MGRFLDLIFPDRVYRREQKELEKERMLKRLDGFDTQFDSIRNILIKTSAAHSRREKAADEVLTKILFRLDELGEELRKIDKKLDIVNVKLDGLEKKFGEVATSTNTGDKVTPRQVLNEYLYGENGDE